MSKKVRGFEPVIPEMRVHAKESPTVRFDNKVSLSQGGVKYLPDLTPPKRSSKNSAGYDFYLVDDVTILPAQKTIIWSDVKAYMPPDEVLLLFIRSSLAIKKGLMLTNNVGVIDSDYYSNEGNDGNIGIAVVNTSGKAVELKAGEKIAQGIFVKYGVADNDDASEKRVGGVGSTGK